MSNNIGRRTINGENTAIFDSIDITGDGLAIDENFGLANQFLGKNINNQLTYKTFNLTDFFTAGNLITISGAVVSVDLSLATTETEIDCINDFIVFLKADNTNKKISPDALIKNGILDADTLISSINISYADEEIYNIPLVKAGIPAVEEFQKFSIRQLFDQIIRNRAVPIVMNSGIDINETGGNGNSIITTGNNVLRGHINYIEGRMEFKTGDGRRVIYSKAVSGNNDLELGNFDTGVSDIKIELKNDLYPTTDLTFDLGKTTKQFNNLFSHNIVCDKLIPVLSHGEYSLAILIDDFLPTEDNTKSIGDYNLRYMDSFVNTTYTNNIETIGSASQINLGNDIIPNLDAQHSLGSSTKKFNHIYSSIFTGNLNGSATNATTSASCFGNSATATALETARSIGGVLFDGTADIILPGVNTGGTQNTSGNASTSTNCLGVSATANALHTARHLGGVLFDGSADISLPGVNIAGTQDTSGNATTSTTATTSHTADGLTISFDANIDGSGFDLTQIKDLTITSLGLSTGVGTEITLKTTILPNTDNIYNLGSNLKRFHDIYAETFNGNATTATTATDLTGSFTDNIDGGDHNLTNVDTIETTTITPFLANGTGITLDKNPYRSVNELYIQNLPTTNTGLSSGRIWNNGGTLSII